MRSRCRRPAPFAFKRVQKACTISASAEITHVAQFPDIHNWTEDFLLTLPVAELSYLDYKESRWLTLDEKWRQDVSKYLSAFANYDGGYLVIGVVDPVRIGALQLDGGAPLETNGGIVQWLENVLPDLVERPLDHVDVWAVTARSAQSAIRPNHSVIVIHVRPSEGAPHQARDGKYYTRHGSRLKALGHRAISDIASRRKYPNVRLIDITLTWTKLDDFILTAAVENISTVSARDCSVVVDLPVYVGKEGFLSYEQAIATTDDGLAAVRVNLHNSRGGPLFPLSRKIFTAKLEVGLRSDDEIKTIPDVRYKLFADDMPVVEGSLPFENVLVRH